MVHDFTNKKKKMHENNIRCCEKRRHPGHVHHHLRLKILHVDFSNIMIYLKVFKSNILYLEWK